MSPTLGVGLLTVLVSEVGLLRRVRGGGGVVGVLGSNWSEWVTEAAFVSGLALATVAWITRVCGAAVVTVPTVQRPVASCRCPGWALPRRRSTARQQVRDLHIGGGSGPLLVRVTV